MKEIKDKGLREELETRGNTIRGKRKKNPWLSDDEEKFSLRI